VEIIIVVVDVAADAAEKLGYFNHGFDSREASTIQVNSLAARIAFPSQEVKNSKQSVLRSLKPSVDTNEALAKQYKLFVDTRLGSSTKIRMEEAVRESARTRSVELKVGDLAPYLAFKERKSKL